MVTESMKSRTQEYISQLERELNLSVPYSSSELSAKHAELGPTLRLALRAITRIVLTASGLPITSITTGNVVYGGDELEYDIAFLQMLAEEANNVISEIQPKEIQDEVPATLPTGTTGGSEQLRAGSNADSRSGSGDPSRARDIRVERDEPKLFNHGLRRR